MVLLLQTFTICVAFLWTPSNRFMSFSCRGTQPTASAGGEVTQSRAGLPLSLSWWQCWTWGTPRYSWPPWFDMAHCWLILNLLPNMTPQILFHRAALQPRLSVHIYPGLTCQMCGIQLLKHRVMGVQSSNL